MDVNELDFMKRINSAARIGLGLPYVDVNNLSIEGMEGVYATGRMASLGNGPAASNFGMADVNSAAQSGHSYADAGVAGRGSRFVTTN